MDSRGPSQKDPNTSPCSDHSQSHQTSAARFAGRSPRTILLFWLHGYCAGGDVHNVVLGECVVIEGVPGEEEKIQYNEVHDRERTEDRTGKKNKIKLLC